MLEASVGEVLPSRGPTRSPIGKEAEPTGAFSPDSIGVRPAIAFADDAITVGSGGCTEDSSVRSVPERRGVDAIAAGTEAVDARAAGTVSPDTIAAGTDPKNGIA